MFGLKQLALGLNAVQIVLVPQEKSARAPCRQRGEGAYYFPSSRRQRCLCGSESR